MAPPRRHAALGHCLYCHARGVALSEEHLVPRALGGRRTLRDAVCEPCRVRTGEPERDALSHEWLVPRTLLALHSSRVRRKGPARLPPVVLAGADAAVASTSATFPRRFALPVLDPPTLLAERAPQSPTAGRAWCTLKASSARGPLRSAAAPTRPPRAFAWSIAKWAYGLAVADQALQDGDTQALRALLRGERDDVFAFVGGTAPGAPGVRRDGGRLVARFALAALPGMPTYDVVLGAVR